MINSVRLSEKFRRKYRAYLLFRLAEQMFVLIAMSICYYANTKMWCENTKMLIYFEI